jgi:hypothetical protein
VLIGILVRYIPAWFPGAAFRRYGIKVRHLSSKVRLFGYIIVERDVVSHYSYQGLSPFLLTIHLSNTQANGKADDSIISKHINDLDILQEDL